MNLQTPESITTRLGGIAADVEGGAIFELGLPECRDFLDTVARVLDEMGDDMRIGGHIAIANGIFKVRNDCKEASLFEDNPRKLRAVMRKVAIDLDAIRRRIARPN